MIQLVLYDFHPPITTHQDDHQLNHQYDSDPHSPHDLFIFLKNTWKAESERFLVDFNNSYRYLKDIKKRKRPLSPYYSIPKDLVDNELVAWELLEKIRCERIYLQISERLRNKFKIALRAVSQFGYFFKFLNDELKKNKKICYRAAESYPKCYEMFSDEMKNDRDIVMRALKSKCKFKLPEIYRTDKQVVQLYLKSQKLTDNILPKEILDDRQIALTASISFPSNIGYISERWQNDFSFVKEVVKKNYFAYSEFPKSMRENRQLVLQLVGMNLPLFLIPYEFRKDEEIVQRRLVINFSDIQYVNHSLLTREFFISLLENCLFPSNFFELVPDYIATDLEIVKILLSRDVAFFRDLRHETKTREIVEYTLSIDKKSYYCIASHLPVELLKDRELVKRCIEKAVWLTEIPLWYREDEEIFKMALIKAYQYLKDLMRLENFIAPKYLNNHKYMSELLKEFPELASNRYYKFF